MTLQATVAKIDDVPEALREHYSQEGDRYVLKVDGMKTADDFERFETALRKRLAEATAELKAAQAQGLKRDDLEEILRNYATAGKGAGGDDKDSAAKLADLERQLKAERENAAKAIKERDDAVTANRGATLTGAVSRAVAESAPRGEVAETVVRMAGAYFEVAQDGSIKSRIDCEFGPDLTPAQLIGKMKIDPRFVPFWPSSQGGGAGGGGAGGAGGGETNPWAPATWNKTEQVRIMQADKAKADRLASQAGVPVNATRAQAEAARKNRAA